MFRPHRTLSGGLILYITGVLVMALPGFLGAGHDAALGLLALGQMLNGVGAAPLYIVGPVWFGNMVSKKKLAGFLGVFYGAAAFGPAIGFVAEGILIGATNWWLLFVVLACMAGPLILPLRHAPATCTEPVTPDDEPTSPVNTPVTTAATQARAWNAPLPTRKPKPNAGL